jgi:tRNA(fMet)-specific endonuclease VapC
MALFMLDTDSVSFALRGFGNVANEIAARRRSELCVSAIAIAELRFGANNKRSRKIQNAIAAFLSAMQVLAFDEPATATFGKIASILAEAGAPIGQMDTLIASHAIAANATLVTSNARHFSKVPGLSIVNWV